MSYGTVRLALDTCHTVSPPAASLCPCPKSSPLWPASGHCSCCPSPSSSLCTLCRAGCHLRWHPGPFSSPLVSGQRWRSGRDGARTGCVSSCSLPSPRVPQGGGMPQLSSELLLGPASYQALSHCWLRLLDGEEAVSLVKSRVAGEGRRQGSNPGLTPKCMNDEPKCVRGPWCHAAPHLVSPAARFPDTPHGPPWSVPTGLGPWGLRYPQPALCSGAGRAEIRRRGGAGGLTTTQVQASRGPGEAVSNLG